MQEKKYVLIIIHKNMCYHTIYSTYTTHSFFDPEFSKNISPFFSFQKQINTQAVTDLCTRACKLFFDPTQTRPVPRTPKKGTAFRKENNKRTHTKGTKRTQRKVKYRQTIFVFLVFSSILLAAWTGRMQPLTDSILREGGKAVEVIIQAEPRSRTLIVAGDDVTFAKVEEVLEDLKAVPVPRDSLRVNSHAPRATTAAASACSVAAAAGDGGDTVKTRQEATATPAASTRSSVHSAAVA